MAAATAEGIRRMGWMTMARRIRCNSPDVPDSRKWTEWQKQELYRLAIRRIESPMVWRMLTKIARAVWSIYTLHTNDSDDIRADAIGRMIADTQRCLWPKPTRNPAEPALPRMPPILKYRNPRRYIRHRIIDVLRAISLDEGYQVTTSNLDDPMRGGEYVLSDDPNIDGDDGADYLDDGDGGATMPGDALPGVRNEPSRDTIQADLEAEDIAAELDGEPGHNSRLRWRRPLPKPARQKRPERVLPTDAEDAAERKHLRRIHPQLTAYERRLLTAVAVGLAR